VQDDSPGANESRVVLSQPVIDISGHKSLRSMLRSVKEEAERTAILAALEKTGWNRKAAARLLKVSYRSILYKIEEYQLNLPDRSTSWASRQIPPSEPENRRSDQKRAMAVILGSVVRGSS
jgi:hypothetical protein